MVDNALVYCPYCKHNVLGKREHAGDPYRCVVCNNLKTVPAQRETPRRVKRKALARPPK